MADTTTAPAGSEPIVEDLALERMLQSLGEMVVDSIEYTMMRDRIVRQSLSVADNIAYRYRGRGESVEDLRQVARIGLIKAVARFDPALGTRFLSFAVPTIMGEVQRYFRDQGWSVRVPRRLKDLHTQMNAALPELAQRLQRSPTATELAADLGVDSQEILEATIAGRGYATLSIDSPSYSDQPASTLANTWGSLDRHLAYIDERESLRPLIMALPDQNRDILEMRFFEGLTQSQIAARIGVSQMQVSRLLAHMLSHFRHQLLTA